MPLPIEDYAAIGDRHTVALIGRDGSVDWLCLPRYDSASCFGALLGDQDTSRWLLGPDLDEAGEVTTTRRYLGTSTVLETTYSSPAGVVRVTDVMPIGDRRADLVRRIEGVSGSLPFLHELVIRFDYGEIRPWVHREDREDGQVIVAVAGPDKVVLAGPRLPRASNGSHRDAFTVEAGDCLDFTLTWVPSHRQVPAALPVTERLEATIAEQQAWAAEYEESGPYADAVLRSLVVLRCLTHEDTGGIVAAATTSLPEDFGGERNWDYRYSWLRDAALAVQAMTGSSRPDRAGTWRDWLLRAVAGDPEDLQIMYTVDGGRHLPEVELTHLAGYAGSRPVRIGNGAVAQRQTDVVGEVMAALASARDAGLRETTESWSLQRALMSNLAETWDLPDHGIWEIRGPLQHFTHSRIMVWVAFDRAVRAVEEHGLEGPVEDWRALRDRVCAEILEQGVDPATGAFRQHYGTNDVDASLLLASSVGFVAGDDPHMLATIDAVERDLIQEGLVLRYRTTSGVDGLSGTENPFLACSFWLASAYALAGRTDDAHALMRRLLALRNEVGLLSEEYDAVRGRMAGNFPQALSHLALVQAARTLVPGGPKGGTKRA